MKLRVQTGLLAVLKHSLCLELLDDGTWGMSNGKEAQGDGGSVGNGTESGTVTYTSAFQFSWKCPLAPSSMTS